jgi:Rho family protein
VELSLWDTAGQEEFDRLRSLSYDNTHAIMLCFSVDSPQSLENVETKWKNEIEENCPGVKIVLVALKCDLREMQEDEDENPQEPKRPMIEYKQGLQVAQNIKALRYLGTRYAAGTSMSSSRLTLYRMFGNEESGRERSIQ